MPYTSNWILLGAFASAKEEVCAALADGKIAVRVQIEDDESLLYRRLVYECGNVKVPFSLTSADIDWDNSRPLTKWPVGSDLSNPAVRYSAAGDKEPRKIKTVWLRRDDVETILGVEVDSRVARKKTGPTPVKNEALIKAMLTDAHAGYDLRNAREKELSKKYGHISTNRETIRKAKRTALAQLK